MTQGAFTTLPSTTMAILSLPTFMAEVASFMVLEA